MISIRPTYPDIAGKFAKLSKLSRDSYVLKF